MTETTTIYRHSTPNNMDHAEYGTQCKVTAEHEFALYLQCSKKDHLPRWELVGVFPHDAHEELVNKEVDRLMSLR